MANTCNVLLAVAFLASLSLSAGLVKGDLDIFKDYETHSNYEAPQYLREKRQENVDSHEKKHDAAFLEELSDSKTVDDRKTTEEDVKIAKQKSDVKNEEQKKANTSNEIEKDAQDTFMYRNMHDLVQALILADEEDIAMRLQQLHEIENAKESEKLKRQIGSSAAAAAAASSANVPSLLGVNMWDTIPIDELDAYSCSAEALEFGHFHVSGEIAHELFCEIRKFWHYFLVIGRNLKSELTLGPLIAEDIVADGAFSFLYQLPRIFEAIISQPRHLLILPEIIHDCVPFPSVFGAIHRLKFVIFKVLRFAKELVLGHIRNLFHHLFLGHHLGVRLLEKLANFEIDKLHYHGSIIPIERPEIYSQPEFIYSAPAATAAASAASTAATAAASAATASTSNNVALPDYYTSLGEVLNSFRGIYNGYQASGIPHFIRTGVGNISWTSTVSTIKSYLTRVPFLNSCFGSTPVEEEIVTTTSTASASASTSVESPEIAPVAPVVPIAPVAPIAPVIPAGSVSTSASASASASTTITEAQPIIYSEPIVPVIPEVAPVVPCQTPVVSSETATAAAAASSAASSAAASAAASSPVISSYRTAPRLYASPFEETYISPQIVPNTIEEAVSEASSSSVSVASAASPVASVVPIAQEFAIPSVSVDNAAASAAASASASSAAEEIAPINSVPYGLPYRPRILPPFAPASSGAASASASASSSDSVLTPSQYGGLGGRLNIGRLPISYGIPTGGIPSVISSPAASSAAAASSVSGGFAIVLPREKIVNTIGHDYLLPGDVIAITLRNRAVLFGNVLDGTSPITFRFLRPHLRSSLLRNSGRIWKLLARDFRDPECIRQFNNPLLLNYAI